MDQRKKVNEIIKEKERATQTPTLHADNPELKEQMTYYYSYTTVQLQLHLVEYMNSDFSSIQTDSSECVQASLFFHEKLYQTVMMSNVLR